MGDGKFVHERHEKHEKEKRVPRRDAEGGMLNAKC